MWNSQLQSTTAISGQWRQRRLIQLAGRTPTLMVSIPWAPRALYKSVKPQPGIDPGTFSMRGNHLAYSATQGIPLEMLHSHLSHFPLYRGTIHAPRQSIAIGTTPISKLTFNSLARLFITTWIYKIVHIRKVGYWVRLKWNINYTFWTAASRRGSLNFQWFCDQYITNTNKDTDVYNYRIEWKLIIHSRPFLKIIYETIWLPFKTEMNDNN